MSIQEQKKPDHFYCLHKDCKYFYHPSECNEQHCKEHFIENHVELTERIKVRGYVQLVARDSLGRFLVVKKEQ